MKKILTAIAALGAIFMTSAVSAEPSQNTDTYYVIGADDDLIGLAAGDVQANGPYRDMWLLMFFHSPQTANGQTFDGFWALTELDCAHHQLRITRTQVMNVTTGTEIDLALPADSKQWESTTVGDTAADAPGAKVEQLVCQSDATGLQRLSMDEAADLLVKYRQKQ